MIVVQNLMERLRPLVGSTGWDFCVLWKLSEDQRLIEWTDCCCAGAEHHEIGGEEFGFPVYPCRDVMFQHPRRTKACELLAQMPSSVPLESGIYAHAFMSYQPRWLNFASSYDSKAEEDTIGTKVLIPFPGGLIELFVAKQVPEDQQIIGFITSQFSIPFEADSFSSVCMETNFSILPNALNDLHSGPQLLDPNDHTDLPAQLPENLNLHDVSGNGIPLYEATIGGSYDTFVDNEEMDPSNKLSAGDRFQGTDGVEQLNVDPAEPVNMEWQGNDEELLKLENGVTKSTSDCSDQNEDDDEKNGKQPHSKNLQAERRRRKKLNDRLYNLRSLVPKISKLDRASILGDAIEYIMELQKQAKELQDELEEQSDVEDPRNSGSSSNFPVGQPEVFDIGLLSATEKAAFPYQPPGNTQGDGSMKRNRESETACDKQQRMEPQVEVRQMDENEFFIKVFGEHRPGGFMRLMEALDSIGLEVTNANVTRFLSLVSNVFTVEKKDNELVQADLLKDSLLELTRNPTGGWPWPSKAAENGGAGNCHGHQHHYHLVHNHLY
ncbi:BHLH domain-containing protein [Psidium guajava]|nr:BHLH domain-containing protein [Psidium guajava]